MRNAYEAPNDFTILFKTFYSFFSTQVVENVELTMDQVRSLSYILVLFTADKLLNVVSAINYLLEGMDFWFISKDFMRMLRLKVIPVRFVNKSTPIQKH